MPPKAPVIPVMLSALKTRQAGQTARFGQDKAGKIVLIKQAERLGNIVLMNSGISAIAEHFPNLKIDLLLPAPYAEVMSANSHINTIIPVLKREYITRPWQLAGLISRLRGQKYDLAVDCSDVNSHSTTGATYALLSGAKMTAGWRMAKRKIFDIEVERYSQVVHASQMYLRLFSGIFGVTLNGEPYFTIPGPVGQGASDIGINCGGRGPKRWPLEKFVDVGSRLAGQGVKVDFILGPEENGLRDGLQEKLPDGCCLLPQLSLTALMKKVSAYRTFISSDTGPMHLAWCLKVPTIAIFLDSELEKFRPLSPGSVAIDGQNGIEPKDIADLALGIVKDRKVSI